MIKVFLGFISAIVNIFNELLLIRRERSLIEQGRQEEREKIVTLARENSCTVDDIRRNIMSDDKPNVQWLYPPDRRKNSGGEGD